MMMILFELHLSICVLDLLDFFCTTFLIIATKRVREMEGNKIFKYCIVAKQVKLIKINK